MILAYYPAKSIIHSLDPRAKLLFSFIFVVSVLFEESFTVYGIMGIIVLLPFFFTKLPLLRIIKGFSPFLILFGLTFLSHCFLTPGKIIFEFGFLHGTIEGVRNGAIFSSRLLLMVLGAMLLGLTTSPIELVESLSGFFCRLKSRTAKEIPMIMILVFRFIPFLIREGKRIIMAQKARGASMRFSRELFTLLFPVVNSALKRADQLALALHAKAYEPGAKRTSLSRFRFGLPEYLFLVYSLLAVIVVILL